MEGHQNDWGVQETKKRVRFLELAFHSLTRELALDYKVHAYLQVCNAESGLTI
jgi:hypothetical protein